MKYTLLLCFISISIRAQVSLKVTFRFETNNIPDSSGVYITGSIKELGSWHPGEVSLINTSGHYWEKIYYGRGETGLHNEASRAKRIWRPLLFFFGIKN